MSFWHKWLDRVIDARADLLLEQRIKHFFIKNVVQLSKENYYLVILPDDIADHEVLELINLIPEGFNLAFIKGTGARIIEIQKDSA